MTRTSLLAFTAAAVLAVAGCSREAAEPETADAVITEPAPTGSPYGGDTVQTSDGDLVIRPVEHASLVFGWNNQAIYVDPVGSWNKYGPAPNPTLILITDVHGDHLDQDTLGALTGAPIIAPQAVRDALRPDLQDRVQVLNNGDTTMAANVGIEAVPMYNTTPDRQQYHAKGRGDGYVLTFGDKRVYVAGDTEGTDEMKALQNIDIAFIPMNLPYTMTPQEAAAAVNAFKPKVVYPYHYRGSDLAAFQAAVGPDTEVRLRDWYPQSADESADEGADEGADAG